MALPNIFSKEISDQVITRINALTPSTTPNWGKMTVDKMLAHCCITYEMVYDNIHPKPNVFMRFMLKAFVKPKVVTEKPYGQNSPTAPVFIIKDEKNFEKEKQRLINYIERTQRLGEAEFDGKASNSFGPLSITEWNNMFYKHLDHHLRQFGV